MLHGTTCLCTLIVLARLFTVEASCKHFQHFLRLADAYWSCRASHAGELAQQLDIILTRRNGMECPLAQAVANVLVAELAVCISRPFAADMSESDVLVSYNAEYCHSGGSI